GAGQRNHRREAADLDAPRSPGDGGGVVPGGRVDDHVVDGRVAGAGGGGGGEVDGHARDISAGEVVDSHGVRPPEHLQLDRFHAIEVHDDVGDVAGQADAGPVGGEVDALAHV